MRSDPSRNRRTMVLAVGAVAALLFPPVAHTPGPPARGMYRVYARRFDGRIHPMTIRGAKAQELRGILSRRRSSGAEFRTFAREIFRNPDAYQSITIFDLRDKARSLEVDPFSVDREVLKDLKSPPLLAKRHWFFTNKPASSVTSEKFADVVPNRSTLWAPFLKSLEEQIPAPSVQAAVPTKPFRLITLPDPTPGQAHVSVRDGPSENDRGMKLNVSDVSEPTFADLSKIHRIARATGALVLPLDKAELDGIASELRFWGVPVIRRSPYSSTKTTHDLLAAAAKSEKTLDVARTSVFSGLPSTPQQAVDMGLPPTSAYDWRDLKARVESNIRLTPYGERYQPITKSALETELLTGQNDVIILWAHNDGERLYYVNPSTRSVESIPFTELENMRRDEVPDRIVVLVTCEAACSVRRKQIADIMIQNRLARSVFGSKEEVHADQLPAFVQKFRRPGVTIRSLVEEYDLEQVVLRPKSASARSAGMC